MVKAALGTTTLATWATVKVMCIYTNMHKVSKVLFYLGAASSSGSQSSPIQVVDPLRLILQSKYAASRFLSSEASVQTSH